MFDLPFDREEYVESCVCRVQAAMKRISVSTGCS